MAKKKSKAIKKEKIAIPSNDFWSGVVKKTIEKISPLEIVPESEAPHKTKIRILGIGGGGGAIISEIAERMKKADFYIANTDARALKEAPSKIKKIQFGEEITNGLGTGMNVLIGEAAALADEEKIKKTLEGLDLCIIISSLGGGTSCGATPVFARISKELGNLTYGIFTLPFKFEGAKKTEAAYAALEKIKPNLNIYSVIPNERIFEIVDKNTPLKTALSAINERLADNLEGLIEMVFASGLINIDFADLKAVLSGKGRLSYLNCVDLSASERENKEELIKKMLLSPLYPYSPKGSKGILYNICSGKDIQLAEVAQISNVILEQVNREAKIIFGINQSPKYDNKLKITILATGCSGREFLESAESYLKIEAPVAEKKAIKHAKKIVKKKAVVKKEKKVEVIEPSKIKVENLDNAGKIRKNALQVKKETDEAENEILEGEKVWDIPAILRRNANNADSA